MLGCCSLATCLALALLGPTASGEVGRVDGISDQILPAWSGSPAVLPAGALKGPAMDWPPPQITLARYVVQWDAAAEPNPPPPAGPAYRSRFEAWLADVRRVGLTAVVALTSYNGEYPRSPGEYAARLAQILEVAARAGAPVAYVEPWNEPNNQGHEGAGAAASFANAANRVCGALDRCRLVVGDFEDSSTLAAYQGDYQQALDFHARAWGVHPYISVATHDDAALLRFRADLPGHGSDEQIWLTEVGAYYCIRGDVRGEASQATDASYLVHTLLADRGLAPAHAFYYGLLPGADVKGPCAPGGADDTELYTADGEPRAAAAVVVGATGAGARLVITLGQGAGFGP